MVENETDNVNSNEEPKQLSPKLDVVFQALFGEKGSEKITKDFLEKILKRKIENFILDCELNHDSLNF